MTSAARDRRDHRVAPRAGVREPLTSLLTAVAATGPSPSSADSTRDRHLPMIASAAATSADARVTAKNANASLMQRYFR